MIQFKPGNGGHGPEAYDTETGQYVEVECNIEGQKFKGWEELRDLILNSDPNLKLDYDNNTAQRAAIEDYIKNELYGPLLEEAINNKNAETAGQVFFKDPLDAAENGYKLFTPKFFEMYKSKIDYEGNIMINPQKPNYVVNGFACILQNLRYKKNRMNLISKAEYDSLMSKVTGRVGENTSVFEQKRYVTNNPDGFPLYRGFNANGADIEKVVESYYDENSPFISTLAYAKRGCSWYGAVTYMSMDSSYASGFGSRALLKGFVKNPRDLKILECPLTYMESDDYTCNRRIKEVNDFRARSGTFINNVMKQAEQFGNMSQSELDTFRERLTDEIDENPGLCGIIMGYDAIMGSSCQFDILNPEIVSVIEDYR